MGRLDIEFSDIENTEENSYKMNLVLHYIEKGLSQQRLIEEKINTKASYMLVYESLVMNCFIIICTSGKDTLQDSLMLFMGTILMLLFAFTILVTLFIRKQYRTTYVGNAESYLEYLFIERTKYDSWENLKFEIAQTNKIYESLKKSNELRLKFSKLSDYLSVLILATLTAYVIIFLLNQKGDCKMKIELKWLINFYGGGPDEDGKATSINC